MRKIKEPHFRCPVIEPDSLARIGITLETLAGECQCSTDALRKYRDGKAQPGGLILARMAQALGRRGARVSMGYLMSIEGRPRQ